jgi:quercetin dioxygenase-like cupin family protein
MAANAFPAFAMQSDQEIEHLEPGIKRQMLAYGLDIMAAKVWFDTGAIGYVHSHPHSQVSYILSGSFEAVVGGEKKILTAGDSFYAEPDIEHGVTCVEAGILIDMFSPMRDDFLAEGPQK